MAVAITKTAINSDLVAMAALSQVVVVLLLLLLVVVLVVVLVFVVGGEGSARAARVLITLFSALKIVPTESFSCRSCFKKTHEREGGNKK